MAIELRSWLQKIVDFANQRLPSPCTPDGAVKSAEQVVANVIKVLDYVTPEVSVGEGKGAENVLDVGSEA